MNSPKSAEAAIIVEILEFLKESTTSKLEGELILIKDNLLLHNNIIEKWEKVGHCVSNAGGMVTQIKETITKTFFSIMLKLMTNYKNTQNDFNN